MTSLEGQYCTSSLHCKGLLFCCSNNKCCSSLFSTKAGEGDFCTSSSDCSGRLFCCTSTNQCCKSTISVGGASVAIGYGISYL